jgi:DNA-binding transcriptional ArsR family regulator
MNDSAVSHHLRLLKALKLVKYRRAGRMAYYYARRTSTSSGSFATGWSTSRRALDERTDALRDLR